MCLIVVANQVHTKFSTIVASNRDEFYHRESKGLHVWEDNTNIVGGKDIQGGGTWLGMNQSNPQRWAAITNYRGTKQTKEEESNYKSRGTIITDYLSSLNPPTAIEFIMKLQQQKQPPSYNGFHLLVGDKTGIYYYGNYDRNSKWYKQQPLPPGIYGLSNDGLDTPWPKVLRSKDILSSILVQSTTCFMKLHKDMLYTLLCDRKRPPTDEELPKTGISLQYERYLSSIFIDGDPTYGTRSSITILLQPPNDKHTTTTTISNTAVQQQQPDQNHHVSIMETIWPSHQSTLLQYNYSNQTWSSTSTNQNSHSI